MRRTFATLATLLLSACAGPGTRMQTDCEALHRAFTPMFECTRDAVASKRPDLLSNPRVKLYMLRGEQLAARVSAGAMSTMPRSTTCTAVTSFGVTNTVCQ